MKWFFFKHFQRCCWLEVTTVQHAPSSSIGRVLNGDRLILGRVPKTFFQNPSVKGVTPPRARLWRFLPPPLPLRTDSVKRFLEPSLREWPFIASIYWVAHPDGFVESCLRSSLARLGTLVRAGPAMAVLHTSVRRFFWRNIDIQYIGVSTNAVLMIWSQDGKVRVLVAGGWSGHNIRTAEVKMPSMQWLYQIRSPRLFFTTICGFQVFNPATERWRVVGDLSSPRRGLSLQVEKYFIYLSWQWPSRLQRVVVWWLWGAGDKYILKDLLNQKYFSFLFSLWNLIRPGISYMQFIYIYLCILC